MSTAENNPADGPHEETSTKLTPRWWQDMDSRLAETIQQTVWALCLGTIVVVGILQISTCSSEDKARDKALRTKCIESGKSIIELNAGWHCLQFGSSSK